MVRDRRVFRLKLFKRPTIRQRIRIKKREIKQLRMNIDDTRNLLGGLKLQETFRRDNLALAKEELKTLEKRKK